MINVMHHEQLLISDVERQVVLVLVLLVLLDVLEVPLRRIVKHEDVSILNLKQLLDHRCVVFYPAEACVVHVQVHRNERMVWVLHRQFWHQGCRVAGCGPLMWFWLALSDDVTEFFFNTVKLQALVVGVVRPVCVVCTILHWAVSLDGWFVLHEIVLIKHGVVYVLYNHLFHFLGVPVFWKWRVLPGWGAVGRHHPDMLLWFAGHFLSLFVLCLLVVDWVSKNRFELFRILRLRVQLIVNICDIIASPFQVSVYVHLTTQHAWLFVRLIEVKAFILAPLFLKFVNHLFLLYISKVCTLFLFDEFLRACILWFTWNAVLQVSWRSFKRHCLRYSLLLDEEFFERSGFPIVVARICCLSIEQNFWAFAFFHLILTNVWGKSD